MDIFSYISYIIIVQINSIGLMKADGFHPNRTTVKRAYQA